MTTPCKETIQAEKEKEELKEQQPDQQEPESEAKPVTIDDLAKVLKTMSNARAFEIEKTMNARIDEMEKTMNTRFYEMFTLLDSVTNLILQSQLVSLEIKEKVTRALYIVRKNKESIGLAIAIHPKYMVTAARIMFNKEKKWDQGFVGVRNMRGREFKIKLIAYSLDQDWALVSILEEVDCLSEKLSFVDLYLEEEENEEIKSGSQSKKRQKLGEVNQD